MALIHGIHFNNLRGDVYGGLTAAVVALPLALAFGVASGALPEVAATLAANGTSAGHGDDWTA
jgi:MFS superfamily sulfate permease-like transporter